MKKIDTQAKIEEFCGFIDEFISNKLKKAKKISFIKILERSIIQNK